MHHEKSTNILYKEYNKFTKNSIESKINQAKNSNLNELFVAAKNNFVSTFILKSKLINEMLDESINFNKKSKAIGQSYFVYQILKTFYSKPGQIQNLVEAIINFFSDEKNIFSEATSGNKTFQIDNRIYFGMVCFPTIFFYFTFEETIRYANALISQLIRQADLTEDNCFAGYIFSSFFNGHQYFVNSFLSEFVKFVNEEKEIFKRVTPKNVHEKENQLQQIIRKCFSTSSKFLTYFHLLLIQTAKQCPNFFIRYFLREVIEFNINLFLTHNYVYDVSIEIGARSVLGLLESLMNKISNSNIQDQILFIQSFADIDFEYLWQCLPSLSGFKNELLNVFMSDYDILLIKSIFEYMNPSPSFIHSNFFLFGNNIEIKRYELTFSPLFADASVNNTENIFYGTGDLSEYLNKNQKILNETKYSIQILTNISDSIKKYGTYIHRQEKFEAKSIKCMEKFVNYVDSFTYSMLDSINLDKHIQIHSLQNIFFFHSFSSNIIMRYDYPDCKDYISKFHRYTAQFNCEKLKPYFALELIQVVMTLDGFNKFQKNQLFVQYIYHLKKINEQNSLIFKVDSSMIELKKKYIEKAKIYLKKVDEFESASCILIITKAYQMIKDIVKSTCYNGYDLWNNEIQNKSLREKSDNLFGYIIIKSMALKVLTSFMLFFYVKNHFPEFVKNINMYDKKILEAFTTLQDIIATIFKDPELKNLWNDICNFINDE